MMNAARVGKKRGNDELFGNDDELFSQAVNI